MPTIRFPNRRPPAAASRGTGPLATTPTAIRVAGLATTLATLLVLGGCAAPGARDEDAPFELSEDYTEGVVSYTVQRGDRLGDIAREFTGDVSRWEEIAASNGIDDPRTLRVGAVLRIPASLIPGYSDELAARTARSRETTDAVAVPGTRPPVATGLAARTGAVDGDAPVELSPVDVNRRFELAPLDGRTTRVVETSDADLDVRATEPPVTRRVMVVGSYTPKGIYAQPAVYSKLLMRVAPGTLFELDGEVGDWYGVVTPDGNVGYLRDGDGRLVDDELSARTASNVLTRG